MENTGFAGAGFGKQKQGDRDHEKLIAMLAMAALAFSVQAAYIVDPSFEADAPAGLGQYVGGATVNAADVNTGWWIEAGADGSNPVYTYDAANDKVFNTKVNSQARLGQLFTAGDSLADKVVQIVGTADAGVTVNVQLWGFNGFSAINSENTGAFNLTGGLGTALQIPAIGGVQLVGQSYVTDGSNGGAFTYDYTIAASTTYNYYFIRAQTTTDATPATLNVSLDSIDIVPEPATVGMLGLGALITLVIRRMRG